jgi:hypothetical protein
VSGFEDAFGEISRLFRLFAEQSVLKITREIKNEIVRNKD